MTGLSIAGGGNHAARTATTPSGWLRNGVPSHQEELHGLLCFWPCRTLQRFRSLSLHGLQHVIMGRMSGHLHSNCVRPLRLVTRESIWPRGWELSATVINGSTAAAPVTFRHYMVGCSSKTAYLMSCYKSIEPRHSFLAVLEPGCNNG
jgi:hypothetical protein